MFVQIFAAESHAVFFCFVQYSVRMISGTGEYDADNKFGWHESGEKFWILIS